MSAQFLFALVVYF